MTATRKVKRHASLVTRATVTVAAFSVNGDETCFFDRGVASDALYELLFYHAWTTLTSTHQ